MKLRLLTASIALVLGGYSATALAERTEVTVTIENLAPTNGTFQTPHWVGFHDGQFDIYDSGSPASSLPEPGGVALERLAEDGNNAEMAAAFQRLQPLGQGATIAGPDGPIGPGQVATATFIIESTDPAQRYFSYGSMVLPSNDFFYANANPVAHPLFNENGEFIATDFFITNMAIRDAGTEVNDEVPANTAFFGQESPNTGVDENGVILTLPGAPDIVRFNPASEGGILADERFAMGDFSVAGYPVAKISFQAEPVAELVEFEPFLAKARLNDNQTVPRVHSRAKGNAGYTIKPEAVSYTHVFRRLKNIRMAHLHLGQADFDPTDSEQVRKLSRVLSGFITADDLVGPLAGQQIAALAEEIRNGNIYVNIHTEQNPSGEIRGQVKAK